MSFIDEFDEELFKQITFKIDPPGGAQYMRIELTGQGHPNAVYEADLSLAWLRKMGPSTDVAMYLSLYQEPLSEIVFPKTRHNLVVEVSVMPKSFESLLFAEDPELRRMDIELSLDGMDYVVRTLTRKNIF